MSSQLLVGLDLETLILSQPLLSLPSFPPVSSRPQATSHRHSLRRRRQSLLRNTPMPPFPFLSLPPLQLDNPSIRLGWGLILQPSQFRKKRKSKSLQWSTRLRKGEGNEMRDREAEKCSIG